MQTYTCPTCQETMERDISLFIKHTEEHILEEMEKQLQKYSGRETFWGKFLHWSSRLHLEDYHGLAARVHC